MVLAGRHQDARTLRIKIGRIDLVRIDRLRDDLRRRAFDVLVDDDVGTLRRVDDGQIRRLVGVGVGKGDAGDVRRQIVQADDADQTQLLEVPNLSSFLIYQE